MCSIVTVLPRAWASKSEASIGTDILAPVGKVPKNVRTVDHNAQPYNLEAARGEERMMSADGCGYGKISILSSRFDQRDLESGA